MKGYLEQKGTPTPDKPVEIKTKLIGKNLFETYEVNGRQYTDNLPKNALISIPKKQYIEYEQQSEEIERLHSIIKEAREKIEEEVGNEIHDMMYVIDVSEVLEILDKVGSESNDK